MEVVEQSTQRLEGEKNSPKSPVGRHSFFIQDILSPEFGNKQLKDQYYAYLHYYYSLHVQNVMLMQNQHQLQRLQKEKLDLESAGLNFDSFKGHGQNLINFSQQQQQHHHHHHPERIIRPTPRSVKLPTTHNISLKCSNSLYHQQSPKCNSSSLGIPTKDTCSSVSKSEPISPGSASEKSSSFINDLSSPDRGCNRESVNSPRVSESGSSSKDGHDLNRSQGEGDNLWPAWVYCTRYSDRPSSGPRSRKIKRSQERSAAVGHTSHTSSSSSSSASMEKRPRIAFTNEQLASLKREFDENRYLTEERRAKLAAQLDLTESQVKIWFQNKRAKLKKSTGMRNPLALQLMQQGLYNHATVPTDHDVDMTVDLEQD